MNISFKGVRVTLVVVPTDLRCGYFRLCTIAEHELEINLKSGKEAVVFLSKSRKIAKIISRDEKGTLLITRTLHQDRFEEILTKTNSKGKLSLTLSELEQYLNGESLYVKPSSIW